MLPPGREPQSLGTKNSHGALEVAFVGTGIKRALGGGVMGQGGLRWEASVGCRRKCIWKAEVGGVPSGFGFLLNLKFF